MCATLQLQAMKPTPYPTEAALPAAAPARLFLALWPPPALAVALHARGAQFCADASARCEAAGRLHLTLHFLGAVPRHRLPALQAALCLPFRPFELRLHACTRWPAGAVVAEPLASPPGLLALHTALAQMLAALGQHTEARAFRPHVTLARRHTGPWPAASASSAAAPLRWRVQRYVLVESRPGPPAHYQVLQTCGALA